MYLILEFICCKMNNIEKVVRKAVAHKLSEKNKNNSTEDNWKEAGKLICKLGTVNDVVSGNLSAIPSSVIPRGDPYCIAYLAERVVNPPRIFPNYKKIRKTPVFPRSLLNYKN